MMEYEEDSFTVERPSTPPNHITISPEILSTPSPKCSSIESEPSFNRRIDLDRLSWHRKTSTPLNMSAKKFSNTLPNLHTSSRRGLMNPRHCLSADDCSMKSPDQILSEYVNPFTPDGRQIINKVKAQKCLNSFKSPVRRLELFESDSSESNEDQSKNEAQSLIPVKHRLSEFSVSRFHKEFLILGELGNGNHGCVFKCLNRINGCIYAVKKTIKPIKSGFQEQIIRNEIYAHGVIDHCYIVRNYSCWNEHGFVYIQNEYCNGGSLEEYVKSKNVTESLLHSLLLQMSHALRYIHNKGLAHMDVKPGNILLCIEKSNKDKSIDSDGGFSDGEKFDEITFKLADLGHVTKLDEAHDIEEGDCRYLPREILEDKLTNLDRADVFSLGLSVYEVAGGGPLPKNGEEWQNIRNGNLQYLNHYTKEFNGILTSMVNPIPIQRPSTDQLIELLEPNRSPTSDDVFGYLQRNNRVLEHKVQATGQYLKLLAKSHQQLQEQLIGKEKIGSSFKEKLLFHAKKKGAITKSRVAGKKIKRCSSTTIF